MGFLQTFGLKKTIPGGQKTTASVTPHMRAAIRRSLPSIPEKLP
jgi:hypothetical protein